MCPVFFRADRMSSSVVLPQAFGPIRQVNCDCWKLKTYSWHARGDSCMQQFCSCGIQSLIWNAFTHFQVCKNQISTPSEPKTSINTSKLILHRCSPVRVKKLRIRHPAASSMPWACDLWLSIWYPVVDWMHIGKHSEYILLFVWSCDLRSRYAVVETYNTINGCLIPVWVCLIRIHSMCADSFTVCMTNIVASQGRSHWLDQLYLRNSYRHDNHQFRWSSILHLFWSSTMDTTTQLTCLHLWIIQLHRHILRTILITVQHRNVLPELVIVYSRRAQAWRSQHVTLSWKQPHLSQRLWIMKSSFV